MARRYRLLAVYSDEPSLGSKWVPVDIEDSDKAKALSVWWNSTPVIMMLLNRRGTKLTWPSWSLEHQKEIRIPKSNHHGWKALRDAYYNVCDMELQQLKNITDDPVRAIIDGAAAKILDINPSIIAGWRKQLAKEPTISNRPSE